MGDTAAGRIGKRLEPPSDEDWRRHIALVARYLPGFGNPLDMTLPELEGWADALAHILERENGTSGDAVDHRARVEAEMRRLHG
jgi:hypothetical protein